ncbi:Uncharacterised protein [Campylobacter hyointestinalis subsp. hyointestinalis]|uniref:Uncharacterized protein n=1 Tax=Campylobacter hyointestinalis subsp. hyointestinalis TaxID=91352 RepID=A0A0S4SP93_CAMHY|nr:Uncharacterised protein [Campylobacter hyointestinalis subsp. hyointestinalis]
MKVAFCSTEPSTSSFSVRQWLGKGVERLLAVLNQSGYSRRLVRYCDMILYRHIDSINTQDKQMCDECAKKLSDMRYRVLYSGSNRRNQVDVAREIRGLFR